MKTRFSKAGSILISSLTLAICSHANASLITINDTSDAAVLANFIGGTGIVISNPTYTGASATASGTFTNAAGDGLGFNSGIVLTTGLTSCVPGPNNQGGCGGGGATSTLNFDFTTDTGNVFFNYTFGSEEYLEYVDQGFNDTFQLLLNGTNIAQLPGGAGVVSIDNVSHVTNTAFFRNNSGTGLIDLQYDGFTTVLTASATGLAIGDIHNFSFTISDQGDSILDSGVFVQAGTFSSNPDPDPDPEPVPEPATFGLLLMALLGLRRKFASHA